MKLTKEEANYIAGVLDSRGSILLWKTPNELHKQPVIRITVIKRKKEILSFFKEKLGGCIAIYDADRLYYQLKGSKVVEILKEIGPLFKTERRIKQSELLLSGYEKIVYGWGNNSYYNKEVKNRNKLIKEFKVC